MGDENKSKSLLSVLQGNGEFTTQMFKTLAKTPGNLLFSPISLHTILSLASQGSAGETREAFAKVLHIPDVEIAAKGYQNVLPALNSAQNVMLCMANKLFLQDDYKLLDMFNSIATNQFLSEVQLLNFAQSEDAAVSINSWVENTTNGKIVNLVTPEDLTENAGLVLVNAVYFKGAWDEPFVDRYTKPKTFYINETEVVDVEMMHICEKFYFKFDDELDAKVVELSYTNRAFSMIIILPNDKNGISKLEKDIANTDLTKISQNMKYVEVLVHLPKFKFECTFDLKEPLTELGLGNIFIPGVPNFSNMIDSAKPFYISKVVQKAFIEVNELGTEAAAATWKMKELSMPPPPEEFIIDHPFLILLQVKQENASNILFSGRVSEPDYVRRRPRESSDDTPPKAKHHRKRKKTCRII